MAFLDVSCNKYPLKVHVIACRATRDPAAPIAMSQYDPIFASPVGNFTPWQIHISPAGVTNIHIRCSYMSLAAACAWHSAFDCMFAQ